MARRLVNMFTGSDNFSCNVVSDGMTIVDGVVMGGSSITAGTVMKLAADGGMEATLADGRVIKFGTKECVILCGSEVHHSKGAIELKTAGSVHVAGSNLRLAAPTAKTVTVTGSNADVTVGGPCDTVTCTGSNGTVRCHDVKNVKQSGSNPSIYRS